ncbi:MAG: NRDE family protein [Cyclobacteriaceae bacterium]|nr:NRDE family protein [Cyclobacteriaceae bacterium]
MCLIFLSVQDHPVYKLIIAANRDEFYRRQTAAAGYWKDYPSILGGRDLEAQGTWMAMTKSGKISLLTNYRDPQNIDPRAPSRGQLVSDYLESEINAQDYLRKIESSGKMYNGFNLIVGTLEDLWYYSNYSSGIKKITPGLHGLSNHLLDTPWPKVERGKANLKLILKKEKIEPAELFEFLYDSEPAKDAQLPDTGVGLERERMLSSMFIKSPDYGSRCSTVVLVDKNNKVTFAERVYDLKTFEFQQQVFDLTADA